MRVAARGELDLANVGVLQAQLNELRDAGFQHVVLDLRDLTFMDSTGVRMILREDRLARTNGRRFSVVKGVPSVQRVLDVCGLSDGLDFGEPLPERVLTQAAPVRPGGLDRPHLGTAFQVYLAQLRQQGRATSRVSPRRVGRPQAH